MELLFVYGTLLKNHKNEMSQFLSQYAKVYTDGFIYGRLYDLIHYPGAESVNNGQEKVYGTIYKIKKPKHVFPILDEYEGVDEGLYVREKKPVYTLNLKEMLCWVYLYNLPTENLKQIPSGDYIEYIKQFR